MDILHTKNKEKFIAYYKLNTIKNKAPCIIFHHGFMSDMNGKKALYIEEYCKQQGYGFIRFDNFGHGKASGKFIDQTISTWLEGLNLIINELVDSSFLLIASSMGSWIVMLNALQDIKNLIGIVGISSAPDFTEDLIWKNFNTDQKNTIEKNGIAEISGSNPNCIHFYPISYNLILDGRKHLLLSRKKIQISCPTHLIHGMQDIEVPYETSKRLTKKIDNDKVVLKLIKDGDHRLSRPQDLKLIRNSIEEILSFPNIT